MFHATGVSCKVSDTTVKDVESLFKLFATLEKKKSLTETRVQLKNTFKQHNIKASQSLPPDEKAMFQAIERIHYEVHYRSELDEDKSR